MINVGLLYSNYEANPITNNSLNINAVSGTLTKTYRDSFFKRFQKNSVSEHFYFRENCPSRVIYKDYDYKPGYEEYDNCYYKLKEIVVLQVMLCSDENFLVEAIDKEDYDRMFANESKEVRD